MSSCHLLLGRPPDLSPLLGCHSAQRLVHLLSLFFATCLEGLKHSHTIQKHFVSFKQEVLFLSFKGKQEKSWLGHLCTTMKNLVVQTCWLVGCLTFQEHACVSQGRICTDNCTCYHTETEVADQTFFPTQSQYTDTGPTSPSADTITPGTWQGSHWSASF